MFCFRQSRLFIAAPCCPLQLTLVSLQRLCAATISAATSLDSMGVSNVSVTILFAIALLLHALLLIKSWLRFFGAPPPLLQASAMQTTTIRRGRKRYTLCGAAKAMRWLMRSPCVLYTSATVYGDRKSRMFYGLALFSDAGGSQRRAASTPCSHVLQIAPFVSETRGTC
jgi:hypothetical protein